MTDIRSLEQTLLENLPWNKARIKFVARFLLALYAVQTVNLSILANAFSGSAQVESNYKRLQRFLREFEMPYAKLAEFVVRMLGLPGPYTLALDRTLSAKVLDNGWYVNIHCQTHLPKGYRGTDVSFRQSGHEKEKICWGLANTLIRNRIGVFNPGWQITKKFQPPTRLRLSGSSSASNRASLSRVTHS